MKKEKKLRWNPLKARLSFFDFWYAACGPCHALFETIKPVKKHFSDNDKVVFLSVSIDKKELWKASLKKFDISGYHVFTENKESSHPVIYAYKVGGYPTTCLIDGNGKIFMSNPSNKPEELIEQIKEVIKISEKKPL
jgi:cytochrome oxidase Cu insertion factor (SCO1/SenC/PrrC family)